MTGKEWLELGDFEDRGCTSGTWIPLMVERTPVHEGNASQAGFRSEYHNFESLIVFEEDREEFKDATWHTVMKSWPHSAWVHEGRFFAPDRYYDEEKPTGLYPVLRQSFSTEDHQTWELHQEISLSLKLLRKGDQWIRPCENSVIVARLTRSASGAPENLEIRADFLKDYLRARNSALLVGAFVTREVVEESLEELGWEPGFQRREFGNGDWDGLLRDGDNGSGSQYAQGRIWWVEWVEPAAKSHRVGEEPEESTLEFIVDNQGGPKLAGGALENHYGWLYFEPQVMVDILARNHSSIDWYSLDTGGISIAGSRKIHFGINGINLIQVFANDIATLPDWFQKIWLPHNVIPDGGLSKELATSQVRAWFNNTVAPESALADNLYQLDELSEEKLGTSLFRNLVDRQPLLRKIHRFYGRDFESVCLLSKELSRHLLEQLDADTINKQLSSENLELARKNNYRSLRRLELFLSQSGEDGRAITKPLGGINDLRQGDAHSGSSSLSESLVLFGLPSDTQDFPLVCRTIIGDISDCLSKIALMIDPTVTIESPLPKDRKPRR